MAENKYVSKDNLIYVWGKVKGITDTKVDKVEGKGLSETSFTSDEKSKLEGIAKNAQVNTLEAITINGTAVTPTNKVVNIDLTNYVQKADIASVYRVQGSCTWNELIAKTNAEKGDVYNITDRNGANYVCITAKTAGANSWDALGQIVDLSPYATTASVNTSLATKANASNVYTKDEINTSLGGKLDKVTKTSGEYAYITTKDNSNSTMIISDMITANSIAKRGTGGVLVVGTPTNGGHATTKTYVDNALSQKANAAAVNTIRETLATKVNNSDIIDNLTSTDTNKPLSANQGYLLSINISSVSNGVSILSGNVTSIATRVTTLENNQPIELTSQEIDELLV